jgi:hypothetical protein
MTIYVISVGISIWDNLRDRRCLEGDTARAVARAKPWDLLDQNTERARHWLCGALAPQGSGARDADRACKLAEITERITPHCWPARVSAELDTFNRDPNAGRPLPTTDLAVLVSSDTATGLAAGLWNALALVGGDPNRVRYLDDPSGPAGGLLGHALLVRVPGMDTGTERGFRQAMRGLGSLGHSLRQDKQLREQPFRFYLSGGFKAAIPYLIGLAEGLRSLEDAGEVDAFVLHELTESGPIRLPLRRIATKLVKDELDGFDASGIRTQALEKSFLEGYAYEKDGSKWRLTPFGEGLRTLFGMSPEGVGG